MQAWPVKLRWSLLAVSAVATWLLLYLGYELKLHYPEAIIAQNTTKPPTYWLYVGGAVIFALINIIVWKYRFSSHEYYMASSWWASIIIGMALLLLLGSMPVQGTARGRFMELLIQVLVMGISAHILAQGIVELVDKVRRIET